MKCIGGSSLLNTASTGLAAYEYSFSKVISFSCLNLFYQKFVVFGSPVHLDLSLSIWNDMSGIIIIFLESIFESFDWLRKFTNINGCGTGEVMKMINHALKTVSKII